ncbi:LLM class F420-dependent oxidoreductase [Streptomyces sp. BRB081]|uniref:LLM class F420-dependent oxidoreductase n=1 Tax=Streptomyces sp. BRB081 TaxID=2769544 RepID=UPI0018ACBF3A|nr:LLM class F420-dependent oxidoreductase [Streptomyces sp. BRB081]MBL3805813.1 LLM class F420-dependent oxidoreductase [Streptomyces sp. BRB081]
MTSTPGTNPTSDPTSVPATTAAHELGLGTVGIWSGALRITDGTGRDGAITDAVEEIEALGYGAIWVGGSASVADARAVLAATHHLRVATGILSIWDHPADRVAEEASDADRAHDDRFVLGVGASHQQLAPKEYAKPYTAMREYLTALDEAPHPVPARRRVLAALGPKMLQLSKDRAAGAHPYLVTEDQVAEAREALGTGPLLAPELKVVLDDDLARARETARAYLRFYLELPNYTNNLRRAGFGPADFEDGGSDALLDAVVAHGDAERVRSRVTGFHKAGADHVALQVVTSDPVRDLPIPAWRTLAAALDLPGATA